MFHILHLFRMKNTISTHKHVKVKNISTESPWSCWWNLPVPYNQALGHWDYFRHGDKYYYYSLVFDSRSVSQSMDYFASRKKSTFQNGYRKWELVHECFPEHLRMGTAIMKWDKEIEEEGKVRRMWICGKKRCGHEKKRSPDALTIARALPSPPLLWVATPRSSAWIWERGNVSFVKFCGNTRLYNK